MKHLFLIIIAGLACLAGEALAAERPKLPVNVHYADEARPLAGAALPANVKLAADYEASNGGRNAKADRPVVKVEYIKPQIVVRKIKAELPPPGTMFSRNIKHGKPENSSKNMEQMSRFYGDIKP